VTSQVRYTLCIDAFSVDPTAWANFDPQTPDGHKNCFLFQLTPLNRRFRVVPVHLYPTPSGAANKDVRKHVDQIIEKVARTDPRTSLGFLNVNGGDGYTTISRPHFNFLWIFSNGESSEFHFAILFFVKDCFESVTGFT
jgi:hypothetical protein